MKERLVGAAVLMAAAIILIPEMLSGPKRRNEPAASSQSNGPLKTYTIDLNRSPGAPATDPIAEKAPPPEDELPVAEPVIEGESPAEISASSTEASPESASDEPAPPPQRIEPAPPRTPASPPLQEHTPPTRESSSAPTVASAPSVPTSKGWAIQLGSFSSRATAERIVKDLSGSGHDAFVMPVKSGANTLYRVRVGPFAERAAANDALAEIRQRAANAAVVAHP